MRLIRVTDRSDLDYRATRSRRSGFTLVDVLVSIVVIALLIGLMIPAIAKVRDATTRVVCSSNIRQVGLGVIMYADSHNDRMPPTVYVPMGEDESLDSETVILRRDAASPVLQLPNRPSSVVEPGHAEWDGIGLLFADEYLDAPGIYYCPAHQGDVSLSELRDAWASQDREIVGNYQYRGLGPNGSPYLYRVEPRSSAILADAFRSVDDLNHSDGFNVLRADLTVAWLDHLPGVLVDSTMHASNDRGRAIWRELDDPTPSDQPGNQP